MIVIILGNIVSCGSEKQTGRFAFNKQGNQVPEFNADSAYVFIERQLSFGPRNPTSVGHRNTRDYLINTLRLYAGYQNVYAQDFTTIAYGDTLKLTNIIAAFNPFHTTRVLLAAHWDTRPCAELDPDESRRGEPIMGADDGASGVAVLLELARMFSVNSPPIGVDIIFFDGEDYGESGDLHYYFLGARHWSENPPVLGYSPRFGILLDMVGAEGAQFPKEGFSRRYAPALVNNIWALGRDMGFEEFFIDEEGAPVADDHMIVNQVAGIPMINIIHYSHTPSFNAQVTNRQVQFPVHWHTHDDDLDIISSETLWVVGSLVAEIVYNRVDPL